jgi:hypothetical protein
VTAHGFDLTLGRGYAYLLDQLGVGRWIDPDSGTADVYASTDVAIAVRTILDEPERTITVTPYRLDDGLGTADAVWGLQVRTRGPDYDAAQDLADAVFVVLHGRSNYRVGTIDVVQSSRSSGTSLGQDASTGRFEWSDNYLVQCMRPTTLNGE